jgi:3-oxoacyl-[acyl-carrier protein] reductase
MRNVVITGGGTGIGLEMARVFVRAGDNVVIVGRRQDALQKAVDELKAHGNADWISADLSKPEGVEHLVKTLVQKKLPGIDVLINNAGGSIQARSNNLQDIAAQHTENFKANLLTAVLTTEALKERLANGRVINLSSIAALKGGGAAYSAAKAAIIGWSYALANELGTKNITVNVIAPGYVQDTEFFGDTMTSERHDKLVSQTLLSRPGTPHDIAGTAFFLASPEAAYITGQVIQVNGGALVR